MERCIIDNIELFVGNNVVFCLNKNVIIFVFDITEMLLMLKSIITITIFIE